MSFQDFLGGFDKYGGSGSDRSFWIEAYGGRPYRYDRVGLKDGAIDIPFNAVSLIGGIQPDRLHSMLLLGEDDGLAARPIYAWPDPIPPRRPTRAANNSEMLGALRALSSITFQEDSDVIRSRIVSLDPDAADEFQAWWEGKQWDAKRAASGKLAGAVGKLDGNCLRLSLVIEFLAWAWTGALRPEPQQVGLLAVLNAMRLIDEWVRPNLERVFAEASLPKVRKDAMAIGHWLFRTKPKEVNARQLRRQPGFSGPKEAKELDAAFEMLVDAKWLMLKEPDKPGRPRKDYTVNPAIYEAC